MANLGLGRQRRDGFLEPPLVTVGACFNQLKTLMRRGEDGYSASDVIADILGEPVPQT